MPAFSHPEDLAARLDRVESQLAIAQLPARYALAVDSRDLDGLVALFTPDVNCGRWGVGREALKKFYASGNILQSFYRSIHLVCGHTYELTDADHARGTTYCRAEHEDGDHWVVMAICYFDEYVRQDGQWCFARRDERHWYATDWNARPVAPSFQNWPGKPNDGKYLPRLPATLPGWQDFWAQVDPAVVKTVTHAP